MFGSLSPYNGDPVKFTGGGMKILRKKRDNDGFLVGIG